MLWDSLGWHYGDVVGAGGWQARGVVEDGGRYGNAGWLVGRVVGLCKHLSSVVVDGLVWCLMVVFGDCVICGF